jgi:hypothetical protein
MPVVAGSEPGASQARNARGFYGFSGEKRSEDEASSFGSDDNESLRGLNHR